MRENGYQNYLPPGEYNERSGYPRSRIHPRLSTGDGRTGADINPYIAPHPFVAERVLRKTGVDITVRPESGTIPLEELYLSEDTSFLPTSESADTLRKYDIETHFSKEELEGIRRKLSLLTAQSVTVPWYKKFSSGYRETREIRANEQALLDDEGADLVLDIIYIKDRLNRVEYRGNGRLAELALTSGPRADELYDYALKTAREEGVGIEIDDM